LEVEEDETRLGCGAACCFAVVEVAVGLVAVVGVLLFTPFEARLVEEADMTSAVRQ